MWNDAIRPAPARAWPSLAPKRPILIASFTYRAFANWEPLFRRLRERGHAVHTALFPHVSDPDHVGLFDLDFPNVLTCPIGTDFRTCDRSEQAVLSDIAEWVGATRPDFDSPQELARLLAGLSQSLGAEIVVRPHPEHRDAFRPLVTLFPAEPPSVPLASALAAADAMITTGSTAALEGLAAGLRVAVLPRQYGHVYQPAGIVARSLDAADVAAVFERYDDPKFRAGIARFLEATTGAADQGRTDIGLAAMDRLVNRRVA
jgi:hypothetical protein